MYQNVMKISTPASLVIHGQLIGKTMARAFPAASVTQAGQLKNHNSLMYRDFICPIIFHVKICYFKSLGHYSDCQFVLD